MLILFSQILAIIPGIMILYALKKKQLIKKEQYAKLYCLFVLGALSIIFAFWLETWGDNILLEYFTENTMGYIYYDSFLITAFSEELGKMIILFFSIKMIRGKDKIPGCICGILVGLGFGVLENMLYALDGDISVMMMRAVFCVPGHALYGLYMGYFFDRALNEKRVLPNIFLSFFIPVLQHGLYDFCLSSENAAAIIWTLIYNLILYLYTIHFIEEIIPSKRSRYHASLEVLSASISCS